MLDAGAEARDERMTGINEKMHVCPKCKGTGKGRAGLRNTFLLLAGMTVFSLVGIWMFNASCVTFVGAAIITMGIWPALRGACDACDGGGKITETTTETIG